MKGSLKAGRTNWKYLALIWLCLTIGWTASEPDNENDSEQIDGGSGEEESTYLLCKRDLLFAYGIENPGYIKAPGMLCKHRTRESCCSRTAESQLLERWVEEDRIRMIQNIDGYFHLLQGVFDYYEDIILFAKYVHMNQKSNESCIMASRAMIMNYIKPQEILEFMAKLEKAFTFLKESRKGFYCSLCDVDAQKFFDTEAKKIVFKESFCQNLVENTIEATYERVSKVLPLLQNINTLLLCDKDEEEGQDSNVIENIQFGLDEDDLEEMVHCYNLYHEFQKPELYMTKCLHYCKDYKFSLGSRVFEGSLAKLSFLFDKILKKKFGMTDPIFAEKDESRSFISNAGVENVIYIRKEYDFTDVSNVYFNSRYLAQDLKSFETVYEEHGIDPLVKGTTSKFLFGTNDYLDDLKPNQFSGASLFSRAVVALFLTLKFSN